MTCYRLDDSRPTVAVDSFVAPGTHLIGDVRLGAEVSVWFGAVLRGDNEPITVGAGSNVQEAAVLHADPGYPLEIGERVTVGHQAMLHGCTIGAGSLIGIQAVVLNGAVIGRECLVGAGALVTEGKTFPDRSLIIGAPARTARPLTDEEVASLYRSASNYMAKAARYRGALATID